MIITHIPLAGQRSQGLEPLADFGLGAAYSAAVRVDLSGGAFIYISGRTGTADGTIVGPSVSEQTEQAFRNIESTLRPQGGDLRHIVPGYGSTSPASIRSRSERYTKYEHISSKKVVFLRAPWSR